MRRFNETFQQLFRRPPSALRRRGVVALPEGSVAGERRDRARCATAPPYDWAAMLAYLRARAIDGVEQVDGERLPAHACARTARPARVEVAHLPASATAWR